MDELTDEPVADLPLFPEVLVEEPDEAPIELQDGELQDSEPDLTVKIEAEPVVESTLKRAETRQEEVTVAQVELPIPPLAIEFVEENEEEAKEEAKEEESTELPEEEMTEAVADAAMEAATVAATQPEVSKDTSVTLLGRFRAAVVDAVAMIGVLALLVAGGAVMGAPVGLGSLAFYLTTWLLFSFLYHVVPLLFWGKTPGMVRTGLITRSAEGGPLTGTQAIGRWLAGQVTLVLLGLPGLLALFGRSFADRASGTVTLVAD